MSKKYQLKIIQCLFCVAIISIIAFGDDFSNIPLLAKCFLEVLYVLFATLDISIKYVKQWKEKKCIENKKEFVKDMIFIMLSCLLLIGVVIVMHL